MVSLCILSYLLCENQRVAIQYPLDRSGCMLVPASQSFWLQHHTKKCSRSSFIENTEILYMSGNQWWCSRCPTCAAPMLTQTTHFSVKFWQSSDSPLTVPWQSQFLSWLSTRAAKLIAYKHDIGQLQQCLVVVETFLAALPYRPAFDAGWAWTERTHVQDTGAWVFFL